MKLILKIVAGLVLVFALLIAGILVFVKPDQVKEAVLKKVNGEINGTLTIDKASIRVFPFIGLHLEGLTVNNSDDSPYKGVTLAKIKGFDFKVDFKSLLYLKVIANLSLDQPEILVVKKDSGTNIESLLQKKGGPASPTPGGPVPPPPPPVSFFIRDNLFGVSEGNAAEPSPPATASSRFMPKQIWVDDLTIHDGNFTYKDETTPGDPLSVKKLNLKISSIKLEDPKNPIGLSLEFDLSKGMEAHFKLTGEAFVDLKQNNASFKEGKLAINDGNPFLINLSVIDFKEKKQFEASLENLALFWNSLSPFSAAMGSTLSGSGALKLHAAGTPQAVQFDASLSLKDSVIHSGNSFEKAAGQNLSVSIAGNSDAKKVVVSKLTLNLLEAAINGSGEASLGPDKTVALTLESTPLPLDQLKTLLPAYKTVTLAGDPKLKFKLSGPLSNTKEVSASGSLNASRIVYEKYTLTNLASAFEYKNSIANLNNLSCDLLGGKFAGSGWVDLSAAKPLFGMNTKLQGIDVATAMKTFSDLPEAVSGKGNFDLNVHGHGTEAEEIKKSLSGQGSLGITDGKFYAANMAGGLFSKELLAVTQVGLLGAGLSAPSFTKGEGTPFKNLSGSFKIENGQVETPNMKMVTDDFATDLKGTFSLDFDLNMKGNAQFSRDKTNAWITNDKIRTYLVDKEGRFNLPFTITGTVNKPVIAPDVGFAKDLFAKAATGLVKEQAKEQAKSLIPSLGKSSGGGAPVALPKAVPAKPQEMFKKLFR
ncbi:MAG: AsmA family protein [Deltaproteobacteria bacterium]|nr:AsmA family protein [Deltaproteobacteria bacterium]